MRKISLVLTLWVVSALNILTAAVPLKSVSRNNSFLNPGTPGQCDIIDVSGTPFFIDAYKYANIRLVSGRTFTSVKSKVDLCDQVVYFISSNGVEARMESGLVKEITFIDSSESGAVPYKFQTGFPAVDRIGSNCFYQVLEEGKCSFLRSIIKKMTEKKNELSGEIAREYETVENFYLFVNGNMKRIKRDKTFFFAELSDKQTELVKYADAEKISFRNTDQIIKLLKYYNSL